PHRLELRHRSRTPPMYQPTVEADVVVGRGVWLGARVMVMAGVTVGDGAIVGAGSVVTKDLPPNCIAGGIPARVLGWRGGSETTANGVVHGGTGLAR
ncbi:MAG: hypothetical protein GEV08_23530, partial [Acidimicrobiia bacterium]|nr:hypothetical protein [Acidimicrobiia bacterium]